MKPAPGNAKPQLGEKKANRAELGLSAPGVPPGYKQTEVGVIPEDWEAGGLGLFWSVTDCKHVTAHFVGNGYPLASIREVQSRFVDLTGAKQTTQHFYNLLIEGGRKPQPGDLILSRNATVGEIAQVTKSHPFFAMGQDVCLLRKKNPDHSTDYLQSVFQSPIVLNQLSNLMVGSTFKRANVQQIRNFFVPMPPPPEQRAIAQALSDVDALLTSLDRLIAKKRDLKQAAMQQLLTGQTRLPGFSGEWDQVRLGDLFTFKNGLNKAKEFFGYGTPIVNYMDVFGSSVIRSSSLSGRVSLTRPELKNFDVHKGDVFFTRTSETPEEIGVASVIVDEPVDAVFSGFVLRARPRDERLDDGFKAYCFGSAFIRKQITSKASYTTRALTNGRILSEIVLPVPTLPEQTAISAVLTDMDAELAVLEQRQAKTRALKQGMMQELLTGRTRLPGNAEPQLGASMKSK